MEPDPLDRAAGQDAGWGVAPPQTRLQRKKEQQAFRRTHLLHLHIRQVWVEVSVWVADWAWAGAEDVDGDSAWAGEPAEDLVAGSTADNPSKTHQGSYFPKNTFFQR